eukprot:TRINITY_DN94_c0_g1_i1.p1 TRINITY_DN94_c0_g1~~TRINITY_DN94_c0_g1_i1.p1  ORF type:complete len:869 (-),score=231.30 TRINITY_DN94_c0_g1_i1:60-2339(-)
MEKGRRLITMASVSDLVMIIGGFDETGRTNTDIEIYNTTSGSWNRNYRLSTAKSDLQTTVCKEYVFIAGGPEFDRKVEIFDSNSFILSSIDLSIARSFVTMNSIEEQVLFVGGGSFVRPYQMYDTVDILNVTDWTMNTSKISIGRSMMTTTKINTIEIKRVFFAGGIQVDMNVSKVIDIFDYTTQIWSVSFLSVARRYMGAGSIGHIVFFGGGTESPFHSREDSYFMNGTSVLDIFNASNGEWYLSHLNSARSSVSSVSTEKYTFFVGGSLNGSLSSSQIDILSCSLCDEGYYSDSGYQPCSLCPSGHYTDGKGIFPCMEGYYSGNGSSQCLKCESGTFSKNGSSQCTVCDAGNYWNGQKCEKCELGKYSSKSTDKCMECPKGRTTNSLGQSHCVCMIGYEELNSGECIQKIEKGSMMKTKGAIGGTVGGVFLFVVSTAVVVTLIRKRRMTASDEEELTNYTSAPFVDRTVSLTSLNIVKMENAEWEIPFSELIFTANDLIGSGNYGEVYKGEWRNIPVAIKKLKMGNISQKQLLEFREELALVKGLRPHMNVVKFYGACTQDIENMCLVAEFVSHGSLFALMKKRKVTLPEMSQILSGCAAGVNHLHKEGLVHRDIAARNVLLSVEEERIVAKIADFGLSRFVEGEADQRTVSEVGPTRWMAPEALRERKYSLKSDVWSFGVLCWETVNQTTPYKQLDAFQAGVKVAYEGLRLDLPHHLPELATVMQKCFEENAEDRWNMKEVMDHLKQWESKIEESL